MSPLPEFGTFFHALWGYEPFPWQATLAERVARGAWPRALDLPTASGKTACIDIALYALAAQADRANAERSAPRRVWFVVDRRIVVDEAFDRAARIADRLARASGGPLQQIAERLRRVSGTERPLAVARLRGGVFRDDGWARLPSQPSIITSTVDQLGSRLLFRGYGRSLLAAPIFAGLAANDSLILLDEAHCSVPFMQTLRAIVTYRGPGWAEDPVPTPFAFAVLSATPPREIRQDQVFPGAEREAALDHAVLQQRLRASKPASLAVVKPKRGAAADPLVEEASRRAVGYLGEGKRRVAVMVNRVRTARNVASALRARLADEADVVLLTGRLRPFERDRLVERWSPVLRATSPEDPEAPVVLVSTQCLEVGADFSFDALVTEAASLDALRQRFGRLDRLGGAGVSPAAILIREPDADPSRAKPDPIYGQSLAKTWKLLSEHAENDVINFGIEALRSTFNAIEDLSPYLAPAPDAPVLLPVHLDLLCQTAPPPEPEPDVQLFLHGKDHGAPEVQVLWRADLPADRSGAWVETVALCPPASGEMLSVPLYQLRAFLTDATGVEDTGDVEGVPAEADAAGRSRPFVLWRGRDRSRVERNPRLIAPHDVVVLPAAYGAGELGQTGVEEGLGPEGLDLWERTREPAGRPMAVRLHRAVLAPWLAFPPLEDLVRLAEAPEHEHELIQQAIDEVLAYRPTSEDAPAPPPEWWLDLLRGVRTGRTEDHPGGGLVRFARASGAQRSEEPDMFADDDDLMSVGAAEVALDAHSDLVERTVARSARLCLPDAFVSLLARAAHWHDVGKLDERFQILLHHGDELAALAAPVPLAKSASIPVSPSRRRAIRQACGLPADFRHEMLSLQLAERHAPPGAPGSDSDLFLHLVASHHGHARPFAPVSLDPDPPPVTGTRGGTLVGLRAEERAALPPPYRLDSDVPDRFWRLVRRYGWWGLAYLEAVLRLGDWYASELMQKQTKAEREEVAA
ncbi:MAG: type I-G CRISPR-associated helicase/endonuclease Cas3g [Longimicrobiaceae bacterium]